MTYEYKPSGLVPASPTKALLDPLGQAVGDLPNTIMALQQFKQQKAQHELQMLQLQNQIAEAKQTAAVKYGTGAPLAPAGDMTAGGNTLTGPGTATPMPGGTEEQMLGSTITPPQQAGATDLQKVQSMGTDMANTLEKVAKPDKIWVNTDPNSKTPKFSANEQPGYKEMDSKTAAIYNAVTTPGANISYDANNNPVITYLAPGTKTTQARVPTASSASALGKDEMNALVTATQRKDNPLPPSVITARGPKAKVLAQALLQNPNYDPTVSEISFATAKGSSESESKTRAKTLGSIAPMANTLEDVLDNKIKPLIDKLSPTQIQAVNDAFVRGDAKIAGDQDANALLTHINEAQSLYASVMKGGTAAPNDQQFIDAKRVISNGLSPSAFAGVSGAIKYAANSRIQHLQEAPGKRGGGGLPSVGELFDGHKVTKIERVK